MREPRTIKELWKIGNRGVAQYRKVKSDEPKDMVPILTVAVAKKLKREGLALKEFRIAMRIASKFTWEDICKITKMVQKKKSGFGVTQLIRLLGVESREERKRLTYQAIRENWTCRYLDGRLKTRPEARLYGGRPPGEPENDREALEYFLLLTQRWNRWVDSNNEVLPPDVGARAREIRKPMETMYRKAITQQVASSGTKEVRRKRQRPKTSE